jgi:hypothetical protein
VVNKDMAYCGDCSSLLHLGESKESRLFRDFQDDPEAAAAPPAADLAVAVLEDGLTVEP